MKICIILTIFFTLINCEEVNEKTLQNKIIIKENSENDKSLQEETKTEKKYNLQVLPERNLKLADKKKKKKKKN